jgi:hypothetical protein
MKCYYETEDGTDITVKIKGDKIKVQAAEGFCDYVEDLLTLKDNGNGYFVKSHSYVSTQSDTVFNLSYSDIEYLYYAYKAVLEKESDNGN